MKAARVMVYLLGTVCLSLLVASGVMYNAATAETKTPESNAAAKDPLRGQPFSDPAKVFEMSPEWIKQGIKYESWAEGADLALALDQQIYPAVLPLVREFEKKNGLKIAVEEGTCGIAAGAASKKTVDISAMCCPPGDTDRLPGLKYHTMGVSSKAIIVNKENPVSNISLAELRKIYRGKIHKWSELKTTGGTPGPDADIRPVVRLHCKTRPGHWCLILGKEDLFSPRAMEVGSIPNMLSQVAALKGSIGYETLWMAATYGSKDKIKFLTIDGVSPQDDAAVAAGKYSIYRVMNFTTWDDPKLAKPNAKKLLDYIMSNLDKVDKSFGIIPAPVLRKAGWKFTGDELTGEPN
ncbi:substrate-binding domain-containing protein [Candidatus Magnetominusculus xianensis]|uniref:Phosphate binding protein n=1 Tax=Candidatus Magnetominusculus xianensis TaxID=1748249 RepID=A0ABR5SL93_9BACT|nr:substrate-binding domain-containing protein [Candidatus Magnetominusculus xianensis]KWT91113.1 phosphate binding protein [Candidatus Magnetominusculus xianensis]MBF0403242.1 substrate-binding domain-containing protein [Nitrospirota bacterium]